MFTYLKYDTITENTSGLKLRKKNTILPHKAFEDFIFFSQDVGLSYCNI